MTDKDAALKRKTLVEEGTHFKGSLSSDCPIEVKGRVEGDLAAPALSVSASGAVHGRVKVGEIRSEGELAGEFDADLIVLSGTVKDNTVIRARSLEVKLAAPSGKLQVVFGECELEVGGEQAQKTDAAARPTDASKPASLRPAVSEPIAKVIADPAAKVEVATPNGAT
jgi:cytoskeletal protein CcmA (bactofilin family)